MQDKDFETAMIPFAVHEAQMARNAKQMKLMTIAMCFMALLLFLMCITCMYGYEEEVTTTTTTTEETWTNDNSADSGDGGVAYAGSGDLTVGNGEQQDDVYAQDDNDDNDGQAEAGTTEGV